MRRICRRFGRRYALRSLLLPATVYTMIALGIGYLLWPYFYIVKNGTLVTIAFVGTWRYGLIMLIWIRAFIYGRFVYPELKKRIDFMDESERFPKHIYFIIPSYKEEPWVSIDAIRSLIAEINTIPSSATLVISTGSDLDDQVMHAIYDTCFACEKIDFILQRQSQGKRIAMGHALRSAARIYNRLSDDPNSITIFMDGDSYLEEGVLKKCLPYFALNPKLGAVTTNEVAYIHTRSNWYRDWFNLKFGQRHIHFMSQSLSKRVLTLTGRFSIFRSSIVYEEAFIRQIENDTLTDPYYGKFRFLMGDDKSSWYYLMKEGWEMLYIPDVLVYSLESRDGDFLSISLSLPYRWYGNTLRNNRRARALKNIPLFIRYMFFDQLAVMWTSFVGLVGAIYLAIFVNPVYLPMYIAWVLLVRVMQMGAIVAGGHLVTLRTVPLMLYGQWVGAFTKIRAYYHLSDQKWSKGGTETQKANDDIIPLSHPIIPYLSKLRMGFALSVFLFVMLLSNDLFMSLNFVTPSSALHAGQTDTLRIDALKAGVIPDDGKDDAAALNRLIATAPEGAIIALPSGTLDLEQSVEIRRSHLTITGADTTLVSHLHDNEMAAIIVEGSLGNRAGYTQEPLYAKSSFKLVAAKAIHRGDLLLIEQPNDPEYIFSTLGSEKWYKKYPTIRTEIARIAHVEGNTVSTQYPFYTAIDANASIKKIEPVSDVHLERFTLKGDIASAPYRFDYRNIYPSRRIDGIRLRYTANCTLSGITIRDSGSNALAFERSYEDSANGITLIGALNKGKGGNGYLRINKSFHIHIDNAYVKDLRHIAIQWASAYNHLNNIAAIETDVNFHGGGSHHNRVENILFDIDPEKHKWGEVYRTPKDASWAPPDGEENIVIAY